MSFWRQDLSLIWGSVIGKAGWAVCPKDLAISAFPALGSQACTITLDCLPHGLEGWNSSLCAFKASSLQTPQHPGLNDEVSTVARGTLSQRTLGRSSSKLQRQPLQFFSVPAPKPLGVTTLLLLVHEEAFISLVKTERQLYPTFCHSRGSGTHAVPWEQPCHLPVSGWQQDT